MQQPVLRNMAGRHACLEDAVALLLFLSEDRTLFVQNFDQAVQQGEQRRAGPERKTGRNEGMVRLEAPGSIAKNAHARQTDVTVGEFAIAEKQEIFLSDLYGLFIEAGVLIGKH